MAKSRCPSLTRKQLYGGVLVKATQVHKCNCVNRDEVIVFVKPTPFTSPVQVI
uniref:Uncharacterized protein n=1 Tax=Manihot esculenta TaxID=3983 RepID=A0A2C9WNC9_MANES